MTPAAFRQMALALPGVVERAHMDRHAFRVRIIFATLAADGCSANLKLTRDEQELHSERLESVVAPVSGGWGRMGWTTVMLDRIGDDDMAILLAGAHREGS
ncbi:MAG: MmcQ/YjbR family DNA-binding protein [Phaeovulum sp.]|uniref:MmcQ/YjbR family DNA-binding protein n=1 Tax=Phaeovulum sp. TaxID=2934796 RepID=UPI0027320D74|nr:MmcQ/YjbR family DNA-binding protein [Phaeovulum sp.]MDP2064016.1 MmcQ/YjbR family DNA-binding protein [Phaeovulum sp.]MDP3860744.1 MmcQ/YjbR family DNA-binding protein [Phaeovulum sp.]